jgi:monocyte-to-macrophage differentiation protein
MLSFNLLSSAKTPDQQWAGLVYGLVLTGLFATSTVFHAVAGAPCSRRSSAKHVLHRCDRAMIYLFIAGSATPWLVLRSFPEDGFARHLRWAVWVLAALGILYQQIFHERYKWLETTFYVLIGSTPCLALGEMEDLAGLAELRWGGLAYLCGVSEMLRVTRVERTFVDGKIRTWVGLNLTGFTVWIGLRERQIPQQL